MKLSCVKPFKKTFTKRRHTGHYLERLNFFMGHNAQIRRVSFNFSEKINEFGIGGQET